MILVAPGDHRGAARAGDRRAQRPPLRRRLQFSDRPWRPGADRQRHRAALPRCAHRVRPGGLAGRRALRPARRAGRLDIGEITRARCARPTPRTPGSTPCWRRCCRASPSRWRTRSRRTPRTAPGCSIRRLELILSRCTRPGAVRARADPQPERRDDEIPDLDRILDELAAVEEATQPAAVQRSEPAIAEPAAEEPTVEDNEPEAAAFEPLPRPEPISFGEPDRGRGSRVRHDGARAAPTAGADRLRRARS